MTLVRKALRTLTGIRGFVGDRVLFWSLIVISGSVLMSFVEIGLAFSVQHFLSAIGLVSAQASMPSFLRRPMALNEVILLFVVVGFLRMIGQYFIAQGAGNVYEYASARFRGWIATDLLAPPGVERTPASKVNVYLGETFGKASSFLQQTTQIVSFSIQGLILLVSMFVFSPILTVLAITGLGLVGGVVVLLNRRVRLHTSRLSKEFNEMSRSVERVTRNWLLIQLLRSEAAEKGHLVSATDRYRRSVVKSNHFSNLSHSIAPFAGILLLMLLVWIAMGILEVPNSILLSFVYLFFRFVVVMTAAVGTYGMAGQFTSHVSDAWRYGKELQNRRRTALQGEFVEGIPAERNHRDAPSIVVSNLGIGFPNGPSLFPEGLSFEVPSGGVLGIVGPSGSGKSTLLLTVLGILRPLSGEVRVVLDGVVSPSLRESGTPIGYVGAEPYLIEGTLAMNLGYGSSGIPDPREMAERLVDVGLGAFVDPSGNAPLDRFITESGDGLSAGQKQRLCLARALLGRPKVLVLDEATANLDVESERLIGKVVEGLKGRITVLVVSHREEMIRIADRVITLRP